MAFTRKSLKAMGLSDEVIDSVVELHTEVVESLKEQRESYKADAEKLAGVQKELNDLKEKAGDGYKDKYEAEHNAFEKYKSDMAAKETKAAKESAVKAYFESKNISGANLDIAMRGCKEEISAIELDGDKIKDASALDALIGGTFAGLVSTRTVTGANTHVPPNASNGNTIKTKAEIMEIKDATERQKAWGDFLANQQKGI